MQNNYSFPVVLDIRGSAGSMYGVRALPTTYIIDKRGLIVARHVGFLNWDIPEIQAAIELLLAQ
jgi:hypothetical protein